ncbi:hypothetical protein SYJ56_07260 [Algoriphagus sp. D3-2-R+10]|uniref:hypothetical protein n=1 Tax=Algoriphagus aurantiacus TaxID=3103948 RepID=UPI002B3E04B3|nr:hypothetical protein [Algoriphagus sp. D3-2-R+10]MEB2775099.1 hypothetical protein [Algoriphagus sp. D3-2-R+10]
MKNPFLYLILFVVVFSCDTADPDPVIDDEPEVISEGVFTVDLPTGYPFGTSEVWLILHDLEGNPIDYEKVGLGGKAEFDVDRKQRYHLSLYMRTTSFDMDINFIQTYTNIKATRDITFGLSRTGYSIPEPTGNFDVTIKLSDYGNTAYTSTSFNTYNPITNFLEYDIQLIAPIYPNEKKYLVTAESKGESRYTFITDPVKDKSYIFDFESLKTFDKVISIGDISSTNIYYSVNAMNEMDGFYLSGYLVSSNKFGSSSLELGYLNEFQIYSTSVNASQRTDAKTTSNYYKIGEIPEKINLLDIPEIQVQKKQVTDFSVSLFTGSTDYVVVFDYPNLSTYPEPIKNVRWFVYGNSSTFNLELPEEIKNTYPLLSDLNKLQLESVDINKSSISYDQYIIDELVEAPILKKVEISSIRQSFPKN